MTTISTLIALPYEIARFPLAALDKQLSTRLPETSGPRIALDRAFGKADQLAGTLLHNADLSRRGTDRLEHTEKLLAVEKLETEADALRTRAEKTASAGAKEAAEKRQASKDKAESGLEEADAAEAAGKREARASAQADAAADKSDADQRAATKKAAAKKRQDRVDSAAQTKKKAAQDEAEEQLDDVRETKESAAQDRADAERLSDLTDAKKEERKND